MTGNTEFKSNPRQSSLQQLKAARRAQMLKENNADSNTSKVDNRENMNRKTTGLVYHEDMVLHHCPWDEHHIESPQRLKSIWNRCNQLKLVERCERIQVEEANDSDLTLYHSEKFLRILQNSETQTAEEVENICSGFDSVYMCEHTNRASKLAAGGSIKLVERVLEGDIHNGMGLVRPPGHHAMEDTPCGFCGFNNVVIAAKVALRKGVRKVLIVDFDLHHGQGTQYAFYDDPRVLYMSVHRYERGKYWPHLRESNSDWIGEGSGKGYNVNVPLNNVGCGPEDYLAIFHTVFLPIATEFQPDLVLVSAGYDAAIGCPEGEMMVTPAAYAHMIWSLSNMARGRLVVLLEGGYCIPSLAESAALTLRCLLGDPCPQVKTGTVSDSVLESIRLTVTCLRPFWKSLSPWDIVTPESLAYPDSYKDFFTPDLCFTPPDSWPPTSFPTRDYYLVYDKETVAYWDKEISRLVLTTHLWQPTNKLCLAYNKEMEEHCDDEAHPECPERIQRIWEALKSEGIVERDTVLTLDQGRLLVKEEALLVHDEDHWKLLMDSQTLNQEDRDELAEKFNSIYLNSSSVKCGLLAAGAVLECVDEVLNSKSRSSLAVVRPPGHHAEPHTAHGFCLFNNVGIAAQYAVSNHGLNRVMILDWDVHHGNGIQHMFYNDNRVLYVSLHRYDHGTFFPMSEDANFDMIGEGKGEGYNINIPWNGRKMGDSEYLAAFNNIVLPIAYEFNPELILISAGFDAAVGDPLGGCKVTPEMYGYMTHHLSCLAEGKVIVALEGGYNLGTISECAVMCARALLGDPIPSVKSEAVKESAIHTVRDVIKTQRKFWNCLAGHDKLLPDSLKDATLDVAASELKLDKLSLGTNRSVTRSTLLELSENVRDCSNVEVSDASNK